MDNLSRKYDNEENKDLKRKNKLSDYINVGICALIMLFFFVSMFFTSNGGFSENEKRDLASFPKLSETSLEEFFSGTYFSNIDEFYKDNFVHREEFLALSDAINGLKGMESEIKITVASNNTTDPTDNSSQKNEENSDATSSDSEPDEDLYTTVEHVGNMLCMDNMLCEAYGFNEPTVNEYAETIKKFGDILTDQDTKVYNILVPTHVEFALPSKYKDKNISYEQKPIMDLIFSKEGDNVIKVNPYSILKQHKKEYLYFRTDHHWTQLGAYYAYTEYCKSAGLTPFNLEDFETKRIDNFLGTYYAAAKEDKQKFKNDPDYVEYRPVGGDLTASIYIKSSLKEKWDLSTYCDSAKGSNAYGVFLYGDYPLTIIKNPKITTGKKAVVIKESYGNVFAPMLTQNYSELYVIDIRYFKNNLKEFVEEHQINDVVFINNMVAAGSQARVDEIKGLLN